MTFYFFDASGVVKIYYTETGTDDDKLCNAATSEGLQILNPEK